MNNQNQNQTLEAALAKQQTWEDLKVALIFTSAIINLYALVALMVDLSMN